MDRKWRRKIFRCNRVQSAPELVVTHTNEEKGGRDGEEGRKKAEGRRQKVTSDLKMLEEGSSGQAIIEDT